MSSGHSALDVAQFLRDVIQKRLAGHEPNYLISDSAPVNKAAVRIYRDQSGDDFWFPCSVHFCQLAMREAVHEYIRITNSDVEGVCDIQEVDGFHST